MKYERFLFRSEVEAYTFDEVKEMVGKQSEFLLNDCVIKQENNKYYLISTKVKTFKMSDQDTLVFNGSLVYSCDVLSFRRMYQLVESK